MSIYIIPASIALLAKIWFLSDSYTKERNGISWTFLVSVFCFLNLAEVLIYGGYSNSFLIKFVELYYVASIFCLVGAFYYIMDENDVFQNLFLLMIKSVQFVILAKYHITKISSRRAKSALGLARRYTHGGNHYVFSN